MIGVGIVAVLLGLLFWDRSSSGPKPLSRAEVDSIAQAAVTKGIDDAKAAPPAAATAFQTIQPSVVLISTEQAGPAKTEGVGAGVVVNDQGAILTARHVVAGATAIHITFPDGTKANGTVVSEQAENDIAVLSADQSPEALVPAVLGGGVQIGDDVFAVGHPLGLADSLSAGVVSGLNRTVPGSDGTTMKGLIQFDAAVNPGSSGGPLLNKAGQVVGIVTSLANPSQQGFFIGIGFAVPIGTATGAAGGPDL
ncbi:MAG TPA: trypsin-like peptidase domain-containing protein [Acidimicrobiales bacterium]